MTTVNAQAGPSFLPTPNVEKLCVVCEIRPHYNDGRKSYPTCGMTCARRLQMLLGIAIPEDKPLCIVCGLRPAFSNGHRLFPTCGNTCAKTLQDMRNPPHVANNDVEVEPLAIVMCYICNRRPRYQRGGKAYPTCGLTCAAKLHSRDQQLAAEAAASRTPAFRRPSPEVYTPADSQVEDSSPVAQGLALNYETFECIICLETLRMDHIARFSCHHAFCRSCLRDHIATELNEHHYPIICPSCKIGKQTAEPSMVDDEMIQFLGLGESNLSLFHELQLAAHSIVIHCQKCKETMFVDRKEYQQRNVIECPLPRCNYLWCKHCQREVEFGGPMHSCDGSKELEHLMKKHGWRHCPGCQIPVQKSDGCNHMTCTTPGCNMHFCYTCGAEIIKSLQSDEIRAATKQHYEGCKLF